MNNEQAERALLLRRHGLQHVDDMDETQPVDDLRRVSLRPRGAECYEIARVSQGARLPLAALHTHRIVVSFLTTLRSGAASRTK